MRRIQDSKELSVPSAYPLPTTFITRRPSGCAHGWPRWKRPTSVYPTASSQRPCLPSEHTAGDMHTRNTSTPHSQGTGRANANRQHLGTVQTTSAHGPGAPARQSPDHSPTSPPRRRQRNTATQGSAQRFHRKQLSVGSCSSYRFWRRDGRWCGEAHRSTASSPRRPWPLCAGCCSLDPAARRTAKTLLPEGDTHTWRSRQDGERRAEKHAASASAVPRSVLCRPELCAVRASVRLRWCVCWSSVSIADACAVSRRVGSAAPRCCHGGACCGDRVIPSCHLVCARPLSSHVTGHAPFLYLPLVSRVCRSCVPQGGGVRRATGRSVKRNQADRSVRAIPTVAVVPRHAVRTVARLPLQPAHAALP